LVGRPGRIEVFDELMAYVKKHEGIWFATTEEVATRVLACAGIKPSAGVSYGARAMAMK
jgi:hypothetical protein